MSICIYLVDCAPLEQPKQLVRTYPLLDAERRQRIEQQQAPMGKAQLAAAGVLMAHVVGGGKAPALTYGPHGKPYVADREDVFFNITHTGRYVLCAVADEEIGLDAQLQSAGHPQAARRLFTPAEQAWVAENPDERFTRLWTRKEAYGKYRGDGLTRDLSDFSLLTQYPDFFRYEQKRTFAGDILWVTLCATTHVPTNPINIQDLEEILRHYGL